MFSNIVPVMTPVLIPSNPSLMNVGVLEKVLLFPSAIIMLVGLVTGLFGMVFYKDNAFECGVKTMLFGVCGVIFYALINLFKLLIG